MRLVATGQQARRDYLYCADATIATGGTPQLVLGQSQSRSYLLLQNTDAAPMFIEVGSARAHATISAGKLTAITIDNAGFGFTSPPVVRLLGGGGMGPFLGGNQPNYPAPSHPAVARSVLTTGVVSSFIIDDPGSGYLKAPYVMIFNADLDPYGAAVPSLGVGIQLNSGEKIIWENTFCHTDPVSVFSPTSNAVLTCRWAD